MPPKETEISLVSAIGIDVSRDTLDICFLLKKGRGKKNLILPNKEAAILGFAQRIQSYPGKIVLESTGRHHLLLAILLSEKGFDVRIINPLITKKYTQATIRKIKSDKQDSFVLARIALLEEQLPETFNLGRKSLSIRKKIGLAASLEKQLQQLQSMVNDYTKTKEVLKLSLSRGEKQILQTIKRLKKQRDKLEQEIEKDVGDLNGDQGQGQISRFHSVPGISIYVAALAHYFFSVQYQKSPKQWIAYAGMDVSVRQSGQWQGRCKLTKRGNPYIRKRLYCAAWGAVMNNDQFRKYYDYLKATQGRKHTEALVIIARKLIRIMYSLSKNKTLFDPATPLFIEK